MLADGALEDLLDDLRTFYGSRSWYVERGDSLPPGLPAARSTRKWQDDAGSGGGRRAEPVGGRAQFEQPAPVG